MIFLQKRICLSCRTFRLDDPYSGVCRVDKTVEHYPMKTTEETCGKWEDGGHQYNIRLGWIKKTLEMEKGSQD
ncbi:MAG TPA: hypothetical protein EYH36_00380 [Desulfocapsa sulfexigens]|nr:hypothetical protein [Desulfocapsa sulfexigens]